MIDAFQQSQQALHAPAPLIQHLIRLPRLRKHHHSIRPVNLRIHGFRGHEFRDVAFRFFFVEVEQLGEAREADAGVVFGDDADVVLDDAFAEVLVAGVGFGVVFEVVGGGGGGGGGGVGGGGGEDVRGAEVGTVGFGDDGPAHEFGDGELFEETLFFGDEDIARVGVDPVEEVGLFVVVGGENDVVDYSLEDGVELFGGFFDGFGVEHLSVVFANVKVFVIVFCERDLLFVVSKLEVRDIVFLFQGRVIGAPLLFLLFSLFLLLLYLFRRPLRLSREIPGADFPAEDARLCPVALLYAQRHLFEDELRLLPPLHRSEGLDLELTKDVGCRVEVSLLLFHI